MTTDILFSLQGRVGVITLNRPSALNALTDRMIIALDEALVGWAEDPRVDMVLMQAVPGRAFCAGGDIKAAALGDAKMRAAFFRAEYRMNRRIFEFPKPYVSLIDGIVMGGGMGISAHGSHRVVTENVLFAMPEAGIGFFPDVGGGYFLSRLPKHAGFYLALTAQRIGVKDVCDIGIGTHYVPSKNLAALRDDIIHHPEDLDSILSGYAESAPGEPTLDLNAIDRIFAHDSVEDILRAAPPEMVKVMRTLCPYSLKIAHEQLRRGAKMDFAAVMEMEYAISQHMLSRPDFAEGVRAALIDKDKSPRWQPASIEEVGETSFFNKI